MSEIRRIDLGTPAVLEFRGPDAVRYLNGQVTQDVRKVVGSIKALHACVTDAKGRLQFRVMIHATDDGALWVSGPHDIAEALNARLTKYLIADDVEVTDLTGTVALSHFTGTISNAPGGATVREANRYGTEGNDCWLPPETTWPAGHDLLDADQLDQLRISNGVPAWGSELTEGMLPQEALLDETDISYQKGCYIGQEVISRIKFAGKLNRRLTRFVLDSKPPNVPLELVDNEGKSAGEITSVSGNAALGYLKRGAEAAFYRGAEGALIPVRLD